MPIAASSRPPAPDQRTVRRTVLGKVTRVTGRHHGSSDGPDTHPAMTMTYRACLALLPLALACGSPGSPVADDDGATDPDDGDDGGSIGDDAPAGSESAGDDDGSAGDDADATGDPADPPADAAHDLLQRLPGLWVAPVTSNTSAGD